MAFQIDDTDDLAYILVTMSGTLDDDELPLYQNAIYQSPGFQTKNQIVDYTQVRSYLVSSEGLQNFVDQARLRPEVMSARTDRKIALISPQDLE